MLGLGTSLLSPQYVEGVAAYSNTKSLSLDGTNDYVDTNYTSNSLYQGEFSVSMWLKPTDGQGANQAVFGVEKANTDEFSILIGTLGTVAITHYSNSQFGVYNTNAARFSDGAASAFKHIVVTVTKNTGGSGNTTYLVYDNGSVVPGSYLGSFRVNQTNHEAFDHGGLELSIGACNDDSTQDEFYGGLIDEVTVFTKALSASEVSDIYNSGAPKDESAHDNLLLYDRFEDDVTDTAGTSDGTNNGATFSSTVPS